MKFNIINNKLILSVKKKPKPGDFMLCFAIGIGHIKTGKVIGREYFIKYHDNGTIAKLDSISENTRKIILMINF